MKPDTIEDLQCLVERAKRRGWAWVPHEIATAALAGGRIKVLGKGHVAGDAYGNKRRAAQRECMARLRERRKSGEA